jgi:hypothetical protein
MKERGRYQIQFMKTRSSSGVGQKVDLEFNVETLRITDLGEDEQEGSFNQQRQNNGGGSSVYAGLKRTSAINTASDSGGSSSAGWERASPKEGFDLSKTRVDAPKATAIRDMLAGLNSERD